MNPNTKNIVNDHNDKKNSPKISKLSLHLDDIPSVILIYIYSLLGYCYVPVLDVYQRNGSYSRVEYHILNSCTKNQS